jgi:cobalt-zinc-cadmium efflux system protein
VNSHDHSQHNHNAVENIRTAFFLNLSFTLVEIVGGILTNSIAIMSDALHDLGDSLSLGLAWALEQFSEQKSDHKFSYGYRRFSLLGSLINGLVLIVGSVLIIAEAIPRLLNPQQPHAKGMLVLALAGIVVNGLAVVKLQKGKTLNERVVSWHLLEDVLGWFAVLIVSIVMIFQNIPILDPALSIIITLWVLYNVMGNLKKTFLVFLQAVPDDVPIGDLENSIRNIKNVEGIHHTHVWSLDGERNVLSVHLVVEQGANRHELRKIKQRINELSNEFGINHTTVEVEFGTGDCSTQATV